MSGAGQQQFVMVSAAGQLFGVPVPSVREVLMSRSITRIPLAPASVAGILNLRGRIVTAIDLRQRLCLAPAPEGLATMSIVTEQDGDLYALIVDRVSEVIELPAGTVGPNPPTFPPLWATLSAGIYRLAEALLVVLDLDRLLDVQAGNS